MDITKGQTNKEESLGIHLTCPKCGNIVTPADQERCEYILSRGFSINLTCSKCKCLVTYDRKKGEVSHTKDADIIDTGALLQEFRNDPILIKLKKARRLDARKKYKAALTLMDECEEEVRQQGKTYLLPSILGDKAAILADIGQVHKSLELLTEQKAISERDGDKRSLAQSLVNRGILMIRVFNNAGEGMWNLIEGIRKSKEIGLTKTTDLGLIVLRQQSQATLASLPNNSDPSSIKSSIEAASCIQGLAREFGEVVLEQQANTILGDLQRVRISMQKD